MDRDWSTGQNFQTALIISSPTKPQCSWWTVQHWRRAKWSLYTAPNCFRELRTKNWRQCVLHAFQLGFVMTSYTADKNHNCFFFFFFLVHHLRCLKPNFQHLSYFHVSGIQGTQSLLGSPRNNAFDLSTTSVKVSVHSIAFIGLRHERPVTSCRKMRERWGEREWTLWFLLSSTRRACPP